MRVEYGGQWPGWLTAQEAIALVQVRRKNDGRWVLQNRYPGRTFFELENLGEPSRWNTLRALRVLRWWEGPSGSLLRRTETRV
jgi:hypothetical protein